MPKITLENKEQPVDVRHGDEIRCVLRSSRYPKGDPTARQDCKITRGNEHTTFNKPFTMMSIRRELVGTLDIGSTNDGTPILIMDVDSLGTCNVRLGAHGGIMSCKRNA